MDTQTIQANKRENHVESIFLIIGMGVILGAVGFAFAGQIGLIVALVAAGVLMLMGPRGSPAVVLKMFKAVPIRPADAPELYDAHTQLARRAGLEHLPGLYFVPSKVPNAFAVGTGKGAAVALSDGILRLLTPREIAGVVAHELSHIRHKDTKVMGMADTMSRVVGSASNFGKMALFMVGPAVFIGATGWRILLGVGLIVLAPMATSLLQLALSRSREFNADLGAVELTGDPHGLASALTKLERMVSGGRGVLSKVLKPARRSPGPALLRTHPPTPERIKRIMAFAELHPESPAAATSASRHATQTALDQLHAQRVKPRRHPRATQKPRWHVGSGLWY